MSNAAPRPRWTAQQTYSPKAAARRNLGKRHPATLQDLIAAVKQSTVEIEIQKLPPGVTRDWLPSWWKNEAGMPEPAQKKPKPKLRALPR